MTSAIAAPVEWVVAAAGLAQIVLAGGLLGAWHRRRRAAAEHLQVRRICVNGGYRPAEVHLTPGVPSRLIFRGEEAAPCSERVVFPDFGLSVALPPFEDVVVDLPASSPGEHEFTCQMRMIHGMLVVDPEGDGRPGRGSKERV